MNLRIRFALATLGILSASAALAQEQASPVKDFLHRNSVSIGLSTYNERYEEFSSDGAKIVQEKAPMASFDLGAKIPLNDIARLDLTASWAKGTTTYTGSYWGGNYGDLVAEGWDRSKFEATALYKLSPAAWHGVTVGGGLGYRKLVDDLQDSGPGGYKRVNTLWYAALSAEAKFQVTPCWSLTPSVTVKKGLKSRQKSYTADLLGQDITHKQDDVTGGELALAIQTANAPSIVVTPFVRLWKVDASNIVMDTVEPDNKTREIGIALSLQF